MHIRYRDANYYCCEIYNFIVFFVSLSELNCNSAISAISNSTFDTPSLFVSRANQLNSTLHAEVTFDA